jgi:uncharacterized membrane protein YraQ (UPF0718 family)
MKAALFIFAGLLLVTFGLALSKGVALDGLKSASSAGMKLLPLLALAILLTGFVDVLLPQDFVAKWLSDEAGSRGFLIAWAAGALTPSGGILGMPLAATLMQAGAGTGVLVTYLTSMAVLPVLRIPMELSIYGGKLAALRILASLLLPFIAGVLAQSLARLATK